MLEGYGKVWYLKGGAANILSIYEMSRTYLITLDTFIKNAFFVHQNDGTAWKFGYNERQGIYYCDMSRTKFCFATVEEQMKQYSQLDNARAKKARIHKRFT
mgnify:CR=1 FL=1